MRKHHKKTITDIIASLIEAHKEIERAFYAKDTRTLAALLCDCQEAAGHIREFIIRLDGDGVESYRAKRRFGQ